MVTFLYSLNGGELEVGSDLYILRPMPPKLWCAYESLGNFGKRQILIQWVWGDAWECAVVTSSQMIRMLLVHGPHFEPKGPRAFQGVLRGKFCFWI